MASFSSRLVSLVSCAALALGLGACDASADLKAKLDGNIDFDFSLQGQTLTSDAFRKLTDATGGMLYESSGTSDMADLAGKAMVDGLVANTAVDIVFAVDTTGSMQDDIDAVKAKLSALVDTLAATNPDWRVGIVSYRDKGDDFISKTVQAPSHDKTAVQAAIDSLVASGGGDWCEHGYAGIDTAMQDAGWRSGASHRVILIGDAPPHSYKDDARNLDAVVALAKQDDVKVYAVIPSCDTICALAVQAFGGGSCD